MCGHTDCGGNMTENHMNQLLAKISKKTGISPKKVLHFLGSSDPSEAFLGFNDVEEQVQRTVGSIQEHPLIAPTGVEVIGYIYETLKGKLIKLEQRER